MELNFAEGKRNTVLELTVFQWNNKEQTSRDTENDERL